MGDLKPEAFCDRLVKEHFHKGLAVTMAFFLSSFFPGFYVFSWKQQFWDQAHLLASVRASGQHIQPILVGCLLTRASSDPWWVMYSAFPLMVGSADSSSVYGVLFPSLHWSRVERSREDTPNPLDVALLQ